MTEPATIQPTTDPDALHAASELRIALFRLIRRLRTEHPTGLKSFAQMAVLMRIYRHGPATLSELAAADGITPQSMARTVGELVDDGLLRREADPSDGRQVLLSLTDKAAQRWCSDFQTAARQLAGANHARTAQPGRARPAAGRRPAASTA